MPPAPLALSAPLQAQAQYVVEDRSKDVVQSCGKLFEACCTARDVDASDDAADVGFVLGRRPKGPRPTTAPNNKTK